MLELWKEALDKGKSVGAIFVDLSKHWYLKPGLINSKTWSLRILLKFS